jgi:hypothetical protein
MHALCIDKVKKNSKSCTLQASLILQTIFLEMIHIDHMSFC